MKHKIYPCLWFDGQAQEAAAFYCTAFTHSKMVEDNGMVVIWELEGYKFMGLNGGPQFKANPSVSFFVTCENIEEVKRYWNILSQDAQIMMPLDKYSWSEYYGFLKDKYGISWQIFKGDQVKQKITPCLLFTDDNFGNADKAVKFYTNVFKDSEIDHVIYYPEDSEQRKDLVEHSQFVINDTVFMAMDGKGEHHFGFNEAVSFVIGCDEQADIDYFWDALGKDGEEQMCGWLKDQFGLSWQIVPSMLGKLMSDPERGQRVVQAFLKMRKFDIQALLDA
jgi:predicted 3-demethylubiquinone-9 3-methyltransferase (glyoxalase superfamily)